MDDIPYWPATIIVNKIRNKEISVECVVKSFLERIEKYNPEINAVVSMRDKAQIILEAKEKDRQIAKGIVLGALYGLPITVKDSFSVKGLSLSNGHPAYKNYIATEDAELIKRLKNAGVIIIGKTNLPLFSIDWQTTNTWYGQTNNPYDISRVPGGSSGGSAAAVAMGFTPLELGSDAGGSIRVPAHFCGVCGLRTTEQALSNRGQFKFPGKPQGHRLLTVAGPIAKNVNDLLLVMPVLWDNGELLAEIPPVKFDSSSWDGSKLKIAYSYTINQIEVDQEYTRIFSEFIERLKGDDHYVQSDYPEYNEKHAYNIHGKLLGFELDASSPVPSLFTKLFFYFFILLKYRDRQWAKGVVEGIGMSAGKYLKMLEEKDKISDSYTAFFKNYDVWITPVASISAFKHQSAGKPFSVNSKKVSYTEAIGGFNFTSALSGHPILVIPIGKTTNGMPVGIQIHAKKWTDKKLLEIAQHLEKFTSRFIIPPFI